MQVLETFFNDFVMPLFEIYLIIMNIIRFRYWLKCRKIKDCEATECPYKYFCRKWDQPITELEMARLYALIDEYAAEGTLAVNRPDE